MNKPMNTNDMYQSLFNHKRASTAKRGSSRGEGGHGGAGSLSKLQDALERSADRELALTLEVYDLKAKLKDAMDCCHTFFHVAGKRAEESWLQFERAAEMYQRLLEREQRP